MSCNQVSERFFSSLEALIDSTSVKREFFLSDMRGGKLRLGEGGVERGVGGGVRLHALDKGDDFVGSKLGDSLRICSGMVVLVCRIGGEIMHGGDDLWVWIWGVNMGGAGESGGHGAIGFVVARVGGCDGP
ncbi:hypothetical protein Tco_0178985 [Tanacetum coccineum]